VSKTTVLLAFFEVSEWIPTNVLFEYLEEGRAALRANLD
jgi:hypothetical protein